MMHCSTLTNGDAPFKVRQRMAPLLHFPCACGPQFVNMVNAMLSPQPERRPTAGTIVDVAEWALRLADGQEQ
jgi:hypothetical protein